MSLEIEILGITFPNPFVLAAGPPTASGDLVIKAFEAGWGGVVLKTIGMQPTRDPCPRIHIIRSGRDRVGMFDIELISEKTVDQWEDEIDRIRDAFPDRPLIASIMGGADPDEWQEVVRRLEPHGIDAFEMNTSCPNFAAERGSKLGQDPESLALAVGWVREATDRPVIVKLTPNVTDIVALARAALEAGADAFTATNSLSGLAGIDLDTLVPLPNVGGVGIRGGYGGPGLKPVALRCTADVAQALGVPIFGCGGVARWQDAVEYLAVGASAVQVCTAVMWDGAQIIRRLTRGLEEYLQKKGYRAVKDLVGKALPNLGQFPDLDISIRLAAAVDEDRCTGCGICARACDSGGYQAIEMAGVARVDPFKCDGCGLCVQLCPEGAIRLQPAQAAGHAQ